MRYFSFRFLCLIVTVLFVLPQACSQYKNLETSPSVSVSLDETPGPDFSFLSAGQNAFVEAELARMDLRQKIGQMTQLAADMLCKGDVYSLTVPYELDEVKMRTAFVEYQVGSILNYPSNNYLVPAEWYVFLQRIQRMALQNGGVPVLYGQDVIHGANYISGATLFPQPIGMAASFNRDLARECAEMCAYELKAASIPWNFSPAMDVGRNPNWPRVWESFGEDVYLNQEMGLATVEGYQGDDLTDTYAVASCLKHFTGYGSPQSGKDRTSTYLPERQMREYYLPQFQTAIDAGSLTIMINSGEINGIPTHANRALLTDVLRGELGFEGLLVSDWEDIHKLVGKHRVAKDLKEAVKLAVMAGMDMSMTPVSLDFCRLLYELVEEGTVPMSRIDESVRRVLAVKVALGLYEKNVWSPTEFPLFGGDLHGARSLAAAEESIILLKNEDQILPLDKPAKILVTGPTANSMRSLNGGWTSTWQGELSDDLLHRNNTIIEGVRQELTGSTISYVMGAEFDNPNANMQPVLEAAANSEVIIVCLGELSYTEELGNMNDLELPQWQLDMVKALAASGKPLIFVLAEGRPRIISTIEPLAAAVLYAPLPGPYGGDAIARILSGRVNPSAKLPLTYPRETNSLALYDHKYIEGGIHGDPETNFWPQWEFGHGLSYTDFEYTSIALSDPVLIGDDNLTISVTVSNKGNRTGKHAILLFSQDEHASVSPGVRRLRGFAKVELSPGASQEVDFTINAETLAFIGQDNKPITEPGFFKLMLGDRVVRFEYQK